MTEVEQLRAALRWCLEHGIKHVSEGPGGMRDAGCTCCSHEPYEEEFPICPEEAREVIAQVRATMPP